MKGRLRAWAKMDSQALAQKCRELAENRKAEDVAVLDLRGISSVTDYFVIASGVAEPHLKAIVEEISVTLKAEGVTPNGTDGAWNSPWVVLDYFDVIVHVMRRDTRERYDLESLWGDAPRLNPAPADGAVVCDV